MGEVRYAAGYLYFTADDGVSGVELWRSDGTAAGTFMVRDIYPGSESAEPSEFTALGNRIYFVADDGLSGQEVWTSDGTEAGTMMVSDLRPGSDSSLPSELTRAGARLFFRADDGQVGRELWAIDSPGGLLGLLRNTELTSLSPPSPTLGDILPLDPVEDLYRAEFVAGDVDPEPTILPDASRPLVFYDVETATTLLLVKTTGEQVRIEF